MDEFINVPHGRSRFQTRAGARVNLSVFCRPAVAPPHSAASRQRAIWQETRSVPKNTSSVVTKCHVFYSRQGLLKKSTVIQELNSGSTIFQNIKHLCSAPEVEVIPPVDTYIT
ncbi:hypothetical protein CEXT_690201 [Caerostris extrusa]|uniref:Uncharacterized protein n=1 Tax=Caerostris extrusa TaxID=172846 RepID=A0AAV4PR48_CAEEX|nr:hypothetical protein CEXT_690201 [Caerostris extrusa]